MTLVRLAIEDFVDKIDTLEGLEVYDLYDMVTYAFEEELMNNTYCIYIDEARELLNTYWDDLAVVLDRLDLDDWILVETFKNPGQVFMYAVLGIVAHLHIELTSEDGGVRITRDMIESVSELAMSKIELLEEELLY